jgi:hypothetical protein
MKDPRLEELQKRRDQAHREWNIELQKAKNGTIDTFRLSFAMERCNATDQALNDHKNHRQKDPSHNPVYLKGSVQEWANDEFYVKTEQVK